MAFNRQKAKGRRESGPFVAIPRSVLDHQNFLALTAKAKALLLDFLAQYRGNNNGDLQCTFSLMKDRGWNSKDCLQRALRELLYYEFVLVTRQGGRHRCSLYALTFYVIDECSGKHDVQATYKTPGQWRTTKIKWKPPLRKKFRAPNLELIDPYNGAIMDRM